MMTESSTTASHTRNKRSKSTQPEGPITNLKNVEIEEEEDELDDGTRPALKNTSRFS